MAASKPKQAEWAPKAEVEAPAASIPPAAPAKPAEEVKPEVSPSPVFRVGHGGIWHNHVFYKTGDVISLTEAEAASLKHALA